MDVVPSYVTDGMRACLSDRLSHHVNGGPVRTGQDAFPNKLRQGRS